MTTGLQWLQVTSSQEHVIVNNYVRLREKQHSLLELSTGSPTSYF